MSALQLYLKRSANHLVQWEDLISIFLFHLIPGSFISYTAKNKTRDISAEPIMPFVFTHCLFIFFSLHLDFHFIILAPKELIFILYHTSQMPFPLWNFNFIFQGLVSSSPLWVLAHISAAILDRTFLFTSLFPPLYCKLLESIAHGLFMPVF